MHIAGWQTNQSSQWFQYLILRWWLAHTKENSHYTLFVSNTSLVEAWQSALSDIQGVIC